MDFSAILNAFIIIIIEEWHRHMQSNVGDHHTIFWTFLRVLGRQETINEAAMTQMSVGKPAPPQRRKYKAIM